MKKLFYIVCVLLVNSFFVKGQTTAPTTITPAAPSITATNPNAPEITFDKDIHDFVTIENGGDGTYEFKFKNTGKEPLIISSAKASCGCTVPTWPKEPILAGKSSTIKVMYDTKRTGSFTKQITITSNAKTANKIITIKGVVKAAPVEETFPAKKTGAGSPFENK